MWKLFGLLIVHLAVFVAACPPRYGNCDILPYNDEFNRDISSWPVDYRNSCLINLVGTNYNRAAYKRVPVHLDWGSNLADGYGIPFSVAHNSDPLVPITFGQPSCNCNYNDESDAGPFRVSNSATIEGSTGTNGTVPPAACSGDNHLISLDADNCILYETFSTAFVSGNNAAGGLYCCSSAKFYLNKTLPSRPIGYTSADAAGLPIFPGLAKYDEAISAHGITHAIRFTLQKAQAAWTKPASHPGTVKDPAYPPYGMRFRLKPTINESIYTDPAARALVVAWKKYGLILADQGSYMFISGTSDSRWATAIGQINQQHKLYHDDFEVVIMPFPFGYQSGYNPSAPTCNGKSANNPFTVPTIPPCV